MSYRIKEIFYSLQGEGALTGRAAVFCRFAGCNLWSGRDEDRAIAACPFCDTDFVGTNGDGGGEFESPEALADFVSSVYRGDRLLIPPMVILTGGEPLLQVDRPLLQALHHRQFLIACETNGTIAAPEGIDWLTVSPKAGTRIIQQSGSELKVVFPQAEVELHLFAGWSFQHRFVQPRYAVDAEQYRQNLDAAIEWCLSNPAWRLSLQTHRHTGIR
ncbi:MAG TPA: 7-carboxy-7-deazaguanine synthase [Candidatus Ozemobacteraceae bacterium]|nr:7-carboxy-7-deazaguanine synthase [Candidatus Ozemobacteraceae bacterium]